MTYLLTSEDQRKLEEALQSCTIGGYCDVDGDWREVRRFDSELVDAALSLLAGLPKVPDVQGGTLFVRTDERRYLETKDAPPLTNAPRSITEPKP